MSLQHRFIEPLDVLFLRGNKLFGDPGSFGESLIPPNPSVIAGALRSRILADAGIDLTAFASGQQNHPEIGTPTAPGPFTVTDFRLARRKDDSSIEPFYAPPADLVISQADKDAPPSLTRLKTAPMLHGVHSASQLPQLPLLAQDERSKPVGGYWLTQAGWQAYIAGNTPATDQLVPTRKLWAIDSRVGVGLDPEQRRADDGKLFTTEAIAFCQSVGFLVSVAGATVPKAGLLRLGGDGRGAAIQAAPTDLPEPDYDAIARSGRCRLILTSPGLFPGGWRPPEFDHGVQAQLSAAAVSRYEVVSGWDLAGNQPKTAQRAAPAGSVYWLEQLQASAEQLRAWVAAGLWPADATDEQRRAEGFNRFTLAAY
jgi:CRISPR-associated protein Cmr3